jgi:hypothetical protein
MLLIVKLSSRGQGFPVEAFEQVDVVLAKAGYRKEVRSVVKPGKEFSATYDGPDSDKAYLESVLRPIAERNEINISVESEETVRFP